MNAFRKSFGRPESFLLSRRGNATDTLRTLLNEAWQDGTTNPERLSNLELLSTDTFLLYGGHLLTGRLSPTELSPTWNVLGRRADLHSALEEAVRTGAVAEVFQTLRPPQPEYAHLRAALQRYRRLAEPGGHGFRGTVSKRRGSGAAGRQPAPWASGASSPRRSAGPEPPGHVSTDEQDRNREAHHHTKRLDWKRVSLGIIGAPGDWTSNGAGPCPPAVRGVSIIRKASLSATPGRRPRAAPAPSGVGRTPTWPY